MRQVNEHSRLQLLGILLAAIVCVFEPAVASEARCNYTDIQPVYPALNALPNVQASEVAQYAAAPSGGDCLATRNEAATWITVSAVLRTSLAQGELIQRFGAVSQLTGLLYWSATDKSWRPMISDAFAVEPESAGTRRADYSVSELAAGAAHFYQVTDTRTHVPINYRLQLRSSPPGRIVVETTNVESIKKWGITLYAPDGLHTLYILNQRSVGIWSFYSITRAIPATFLAKGHENSYVNRAIALFRHYMGLPVSEEPPAAR